MARWILFEHVGDTVPVREVARCEARTWEGAVAMLAAAAGGREHIVHGPSQPSTAGPSRKFYVQSVVSYEVDGPARRLLTRPFRPPQQRTT